MIFKNKLFLIVIAFILIFGGVSTVSAGCWKYCTKDKCTYNSDYPFDGKVCWRYLGDEVETGEYRYQWGSDDFCSGRSDCFNADSQNCVNSYQLDGQNQCYGVKKYTSGENIYEWGTKSGSKSCPSGDKDSHCTAVEDIYRCISNAGETYQTAENYLCVNNYSADSLVSCGDGLLKDIPRIIPKTIHIIYLLIQILVPVLLVVFGSIDFVKAMIASKDEEIKKGQQIFIKRLIAGILLFFVFAIVRVIISFAGDDNKSKILNCASCFISNDSNCVGG